MLTRDDGDTELTLHVELPASPPDDGEPGWWSMAADGWRDTVDRLTTAPARTPTAR